MGCNLNIHHLEVGYIPLILTTDPNLVFRSIPRVIYPRQVVAFSSCMELWIGQQRGSIGGKFLGHPWANKKKVPGCLGLYREWNSTHGICISYWIWGYSII